MFHRERRRGWEMRGGPAGAIGLLATLLVLCPSILESSAWAADRTAVKAGKIYTGDGTVIEGGAILIRDGKIVRVQGSAAAIPSDYRVIDRPGDVVMPGMVDVRTALGSLGETYESSDAVTADLSVADAINLGDEDFQSALRFGVTTVVVVPSTRNVFAGRSAVLKTSGADGHVQILKDKGPQHLSLLRETLQVTRFPTSEIGLAQLVRDELSRAKEDRDSPLHAASQGQEVLLVAAGSAFQVEQAIGFAQAYSLKMAIMGADGAMDFAGRLAPHYVVLDPAGFASSERRLLYADRLAQSGVSLALTSRMPQGHAASLRTSASLAASYGVDDEKALAAITAVPAAIAGLSDRVGRIAEGLDADLVLLSGNPLDVSATVRDVFVDGAHVYHATSPVSPWESADSKEGR